MTLLTDAYWQAASAADDDDVDEMFCCLADVMGPGDDGYGNTWCGAGGGGGDGQCCFALSRRLAMLVPVGHCDAISRPVLYR